jgi:glycine cleavage system H lipoate-binding protein
MSEVQVKVPDIGDFKDVAVIEVLVKAGDTVKVEQSLITVESDKASMEIPSSHAGVVKAVAIRSPMLILSPTLIATNLTTPAWLDGISIDALSDSTVIRDCSTLTVSPALTSTSITATSLKSPMSGTLTCTSLMGCLPSENDAAVVRQQLPEIGVETRCRRAVDHAVVV